MTKLRSEIEKLMNESEKPLAVPDMMRSLKKRGYAPHKTSLYRNIEKLIEEGVIEEVFLDATSVYYESRKVHHHHALCKICHGAFCIAYDVCERGMTQLEGVAKKAGFISSEHHVVLHGTCLACRNA